MRRHLVLAATIALLLASCSKDADSVNTQGQSGSITRFAVYDHFMYVLNQNEVQTYDISQKDAPKLVHRLPTDYGLETITIYDHAIFIGSVSALYILNIDNPAAPYILAKSDRLSDIGFTGCDPVVVKDDYAYSTLKIIRNACGSIAAQSALVVYDISDKSAPVSVGVYPMNIPNGLGYKDNYLFVCDEGSDQLRIFDISNPLDVQETSWAVNITDPYDLIVDGERMIVSSKTDFQIFDLADVVHLKKLGQIPK
ncbi:MAG: hypothetical protein JNM22_16965 [Saprospiraceae bacterium]|nr:hypothetical protein [Saprospiraceae bacterium]